MYGTRQILENTGFVLLCSSMLRISLAWLDRFLGAGSYLFVRMLILLAIIPCTKKVVWPCEQNYSFEIALFGFILLLIVYWRLAMQVNIRQSFFHQSFAAAFSPNFFTAKVSYRTVYTIIQYYC